MEQRSPDWYAARLGKATASRIADIVAKTKTGYSTSRANYLAELLCERLTGVTAESYVSPAMQWGTDKEQEALSLYEFRADETLEPVGFVDHPTIAMSGASPDGLVGDRGLVEVKAPLTATHLDTLLGRSVPGRYQTQIQWQLACTGRAWCDFVSFDPRLPGNMRLVVRRLHRDDLGIAELENGARHFLAELEAKLEEINEAVARSTWPAHS